MDDFDLASTFDVQPLELPSQPVAPAQPQKKGGMGDLARLLPVLAAAMKGGGRAGVAGLLQGIQRAKAAKQAEQQQQFQNDRLAAGDQRAQQQSAWTQHYQQQQMQQATQQRRATFLNQFTTGLGTLEDDEAVRAYLQLQQGQAPAFGVNPADLESATLQMVKPSTLQKKAATKKIAALKSQFGEKWLEQGGKFLHEVNGQNVPLTAVLEMAGMAPDPNAQQAPSSSVILPDVPLDRQHAAAVAAGNEPLAKMIESAMSRQDATRRDPQRQPIQITVGDSGLTQAQIGAAAGLRDDYRTESKDFYAARDGYERVLASAKDPSAAGDMALLYGYMKLLDPNSVVRETEFAQAARTGSLPQQIQARALSLINGQRLTPEQRTDFLNRAQALFGKSQARQTSRKTNYTGIARRSGVPVELVVQDDLPVDESVVAPKAATAAGAGTTTKVGRFDVTVSEP